MLPGGEMVRAEIRGKVYFAQNVPPINIYPMLFLTARKQVRKQEDNIYVAIFEDADDIDGVIKEIKEKSKTKKNNNWHFDGKLCWYRGLYIQQRCP